jgi:ribosomal protein S27AE
MYHRRVIEEPEAETDEEERPPEPLACPRCGSTDRRRRKRFVTFVLIALMAVAFGLAFDQAEAAFYFILAAAVFAIIADRWVCGDCGESWK